MPATAATSVVGGGKGLPDVGMDADLLLSPAGFVSLGAGTSNGGTSLSSPLSLGAWAQLQGAHKNTLGFAAPALYALATPGAPFSTLTGMTDVTLGTNGIYPATAGCTAAMTATPSSERAPLNVAFNASGSHDPNSGGAIKQYSFNFGDGSAVVTQKTPTVSHSYTAAASHVASVTVTDSEGGTASATVTVKTTQ